MKNRTMLGIVCILLAIAVSFGVSPIINRLTSEKASIIRVVKDIPQGEQITANDVKVIMVGGYNLPANIIRGKDAGV